MKTLLSLLSLLLFGSVALAAPRPPDIIPAKGGNILITPIFHGSLQIEYRGTVIHVDPFSAGDYSGTKKADVILITHSHPDHLDTKAINRLYKISNDPVVPADTVVMAPAAAANFITEGLPATAKNSGAVASEIKNGESGDFILMQGTELGRVQAVPMYNLARGPKPGQKYHPKGQFNGYILTLGGKRIYIAGDTEATPEMKALKNIDVAFLPMNLPFTMTPQEAATGAKAFKPRIVYPYHYRYPFDKKNDNPQQFARALQGTGIEVRLRGWYDRPAKP